MRNPLILSLLIISLFISYFSFSPPAKELNSNNSSASVAIKTNSSKPNFPERCLGVWEGTMLIYKFNKVQDSLKATFTVTKTDVPGTYTWKTEYLAPERTIVKDYKLVVDDPDQGRYLLDEGDGIKLVGYNVQNKLYSLFKLDDIYLTSCTEIAGDNIIFEVTSGKEYNVTERDIKNFSFTNVQRVVFHKVQ